MFSRRCRTPSHLTGLSDRCFTPTLLFSAFYQNAELLYPENGGFVNRTNCSCAGRNASRTHRCDGNCRGRCPHRPAYTFPWGGSYMRREIATGLSAVAMTRSRCSTNAEGAVESVQKFRKIEKILYFPLHTRIFSVKCLASNQGKSAFFTNFPAPKNLLCKFYKKVAKFRIFGLILRKLSHTIGEQVAKEPLCSAQR